MNNKQNKEVEAEVVNEIPAEAVKAKVVDDTPVSFGTPLTTQALIDKERKAIKNLEKKIESLSEKQKECRAQILLCRKRIALYEKAAML